MDEFIAKWVKPFYRQGLMRSDVNAVKLALSEIDEGVVDRLLGARGWRERIVGSWFCGLKGWTQYADLIGRLLLASEVCYAGRGHCFALACFGDDQSRRYLQEYLDYYLRRPDLYYDQHWAMPALMWIDEQHGTGDAAPYLAPGGLWETFTADKNEAWHLDVCKDRFWRLMNYCRQHFLTSEQPHHSPLDVAGVDLGLSTEEIVEFVHEGRKGSEQ